MAYHGKNANLELASSDIVNLQSWGLQPIGDVADVSAMGDDWLKNLEGLVDFTASAEGISDKALDTVALLGSGGSLNLSLTDGGPALSGGALVVSIAETVNHESEGTISYGFEGNDAAGLVYAAAGGNAPAGSNDPFHGKTLDAKFNDGALTQFTCPREWSINLVCSTADSSCAHATNRGRTRIAGIKSGTATVICLAEGDREVEEGDVLTDLQLHRTRTLADGYYTGAAKCTGAEFGVDRDGVDIITYTFQFHDTVDLAVA